MIAAKKRALYRQSMPLPSSEAQKRGKSRNLRDGQTECQFSSGCDKSKLSNYHAAAKSMPKSHNVNAAEGVLAFQIKSRAKE